MREHTEKEIEIMQLALERYQGEIEERITDLESKLNKVKKVREHLRKISKKLKRGEKTCAE